MSARQPLANVTNAANAKRKRNKNKAARRKRDRLAYIAAIKENIPEADWSDSVRRGQRLTTTKKNCPSSQPANQRRQPSRSSSHRASQPSRSRQARRRERSREDPERVNRRNSKSPTRRQQHPSRSPRALRSSRLRRQTAAMQAYTAERAKRAEAAASRAAQRQRQAAAAESAASSSSSTTGHRFDGLSDCEGGGYSEDDISAPLRLDVDDAQGQVPQAHPSSSSSGGASASNSDVSDVSPHPVSSTPP